MSGFDFDDVYDRTLAAWHDGADWSEAWEQARAELAAEAVETVTLTRAELSALLSAVGVQLPDAEAVASELRNLEAPPSPAVRKAQLEQKRRARERAAAEERETERRDELEWVRSLSLEDLRRVENMASMRGRDTTPSVFGTPVYKRPHVELAQARRCFVEAVEALTAHKPAHAQSLFEAVLSLRKPHAKATLRESDEVVEELGDRLLPLLARPAARRVVPDELARAVRAQHAPSDDDDHHHTEPTEAVAS